MCASALPFQSSSVRYPSSYLQGPSSLGMICRAGQGQLLPLSLTGTKPDAHRLAPAPGPAWASPPPSTRPTNSSPPPSSPPPSSLRCVLLLALYAVAALCTVIAFNVATGAGDSYFTQLSYIGLAAYYCAAAVQTLAYARYGRYPLRRWPRALQALHVLLQSTITSFPLIVTVVF
ncbi:hypothetical protein DFH09DRAFT_1303103 [Mycena vulgaris]|nr:hypothetical protein DFH09DRAFT_1303103 [Mycena vulgaris]